MSRIRPPLTTSMTVPVTMPSSSLIFSIVPQARSYCARFLDRISRPSLSSFWRTRASTWSPTRDDLVGVDVVLDRQLAGGDDALGLVADVEQDLVAVDLDDDAFDDVAVVEVLDRLVDGGEEGLLVADVVDRDLGGGGGVDACRHKDWDSVGDRCRGGRLAWCEGLSCERWTRARRRPTSKDRGDFSTHARRDPVSGHASPQRGGQPTRERDQGSTRGVPSRA